MHHINQIKEKISTAYKAVSTLMHASKLFIAGNQTEAQHYEDGFNGNYPIADGDPIAKALCKLIDEMPIELDALRMQLRGVDMGGFFTIPADFNLANTPYKALTQSCFFQDGDEAQYPALIHNGIGYNQRENNHHLQLGMYDGFYIPRFSHPTSLYFLLHALHHKSLAEYYAGIHMDRGLSQPFAHYQHPSDFPGYYYKPVVIDNSDNIWTPLLNQLGFTLSSGIYHHASWNLHICNTPDAITHAMQDGMATYIKALTELREAGHSPIPYPWEQKQITFSRLEQRPTTILFCTHSPHKMDAIEDITRPPNINLISLGDIKTLVEEANEIAAGSKGSFSRKTIDRFGNQATNYAMEIIKDSDKDQRNRLLDLNIPYQDAPEISRTFTGNAYEKAMAAFYALKSLPRETITMLSHLLGCEYDDIYVLVDDSGLNFDRRTIAPFFPLPTLATALGCNGNNYGAISQFLSRDDGTTAATINQLTQPNGLINFKHIFNVINGKPNDDDIRHHQAIMTLVQKIAAGTSLEHDKLYNDIILLFILRDLEHHQNPHFPGVELAPFYKHCGDKAGRGTISDFMHRVNQAYIAANDSSAEITTDITSHSAIILQRLKSDGKPIIFPRHATFEGIFKADPNMPETEKISSWHLLYPYGSDTSAAGMPDIDPSRKAYEAALTDLIDYMHQHPAIAESASAYRTQIIHD